MSPPLLEFRAATLGYGRRVVLRDVNLAVAAGDFILIGGPNGGGKTTLLRTVAGLLPLLGGERRGGGVRFGYVPQQATIEPPLPITARELVTLGASAALPWWRAVFGLSRARIAESLRACRADSFASRPVAQLSGGQRQRILLARALSLRPSFLLLDEPMAGVDQETQATLADLLATLNREQGMTVLLITHELTAFAAIATRTLSVQAGLCRAIE